MLDLEFSEEQDMLRETVRGVCATYSPVEVVREMEDDPVGYPADDARVPDLRRKPLDEVLVHQA